MNAKELRALEDIERQLLWTAMWMVHNANHLRDDSEEDLKVGGHQASSASMVAMLVALYFRVLRPQDRVAVKPHAAPVFHAMQYLMGNQSLENLKNFRGFGGAQSYPSRTKDAADVDFSTGSVGLGVGITAFASIIQDFISGKNWQGSAEIGRMVALIGDAELDEGNIFECLQEGWKHGLRNVWWVVDYNRQSLDGIVQEGLWERIEAVFEAFGWRVVRIKYGQVQEAAFRQPGGQKLRSWIDSCPNQIYSALTFQGGAAWRTRLHDDLGNNADLRDLIDGHSDEALARLMTDLGGHCQATLGQAFDQVDDDRPTLFLAYTIKGWATPLAGHKDNHAGLMTVAQFTSFQTGMKVAQGAEWEPCGAMRDAEATRSYMQKARFFRSLSRCHGAPPVPVPERLSIAGRFMSTQTAFGRMLDEIGRGDSALADRIVTTSPDVTVSTNLGGWVNRRGLFANQSMPDSFHEHRIPSTQKWAFSPGGQHIELGIAEMNLFLALAAAGLSHALFNQRLIPIGTVYDPFICRGLDALNYGCYQDARFILAGTPSGVTLAPEGGAHQSIGTPLIGIAQDGLASFEPAFADELSAILFWAFDYIQRDGSGDVDERTWLRDETGGSVYLRLSTRRIEQPERNADASFAVRVVDGAYWLRPPGQNTDLVIAYQGCVAPEAIEAAGRIGNDRRDIAVLAVTSADRLNAGWTAAKRSRQRGIQNARSAIEHLLDGLPRHCAIITVIDGHPLTLAWLGAVAGHRVIPLGVEHFGQTGRIEDLYHHFAIDADSIVAAAEQITDGPPIRLGRVIA